MLENDEVNIKKSLSVFNTITSLGQKNGNEYQYNGLTAKSDFDGYTIVIKNDYVSLTIFFHNKFSLEATNNKEKLSFLEKIEQIHSSTKTNNT